ncbi:MAG: YicC family protein [candidate division NC10 bacterium]|nr:YicC family protein [candidate division NC10 bacterium]MBI3003266.1 YicC family protein [candidate division NC10 bacterium]
MLKSMTGFGRGEHTTPRAHYRVEVQALNHRFVEVRARLPRRLWRLEHQIQREVQNRFGRGRFEVHLTERLLGDSPRTVHVDRAAARQFVAAVRALQQELALPGTLSIEALIGLRDLVSLEEPEEEAGAGWEEIRPALEQALADLEAMREKEGAALAAELRHRLDLLERGRSTVLARAPETVSAYRARLQARVAALAAGVSVEPGRLEQEVVLFADRADITEEGARLASHLAQFRDLLEAPGPQGRRLEFLLQEINREVNTLGSKAADAGIAAEVVAMKAELEKIREQLQNVE